MTRKKSLNKFSKSTKSRGFTLIELLVVVGIISILAGSLLLVINPAAIMKKSRDSRRMTDIDELRSALLLALSEGEISLVDTATPCGTDGCDRSEGGIVADGTGYVRFTVLGSRGLELSTLPQDPLSDSSYIYGSDGTDFEINVVLEHEDNASRMVDDGGTSNDYWEIGTDLSIL